MATIYSETNYLGLDIGTTSVKACLSSAKSGQLFVIKSEKRETCADVQVSAPAAGREQSPYKIIVALQECLMNLGSELANTVGIGVCGQMHGVVLWTRDLVWGDISRRDNFENKVSNLITWEDGRCDSTFLSSLPVSSSGYKLCSGFGCCTLIWLARHDPSFLFTYQLSGTIMDLVVFLLCQAPSALISEQCAYSWGYYSPVRGDWDREQLSSIGLPLNILPQVSTAVVAGNLAVSLSCLKLGTPVSVGLGDLQCSVLSAAPTASELVVNIGTSAQAVLLCEDRGETPCCDAITSVPYFRGRHLLVAAALNGGSVIAKFVDTLESWCRELGGGLLDRETVYDKVIESGLKYLDTDLLISPTLLGERHKPGARASVTNIGPDNLSLGSISSALCRGLIENIAAMLSPEFVRSRGVFSLIGCGSVLERNKLVQEHLKRVYAIPMSLAGPDASAALGASTAMYRDTA